MDTEQVPIGSLVPDPSNVRSHPEKNLDSILGSLKRFGQQKPIVVGADNVIIAGNGTFMAAKMLGWEKIAIVRSNLIGPERTAFAIADNRTSELAEWDDDALARQMLALADSDADLARACGFDDNEIQEMVSRMKDEEEASDIDAPVDLDRADELREKWGTEPGQLWALGEHRLLCGDSLLVDSARRVCSDDLIDLVLTDPPYGVAYVGKTKDALTIDNDDLDMSELAGFAKAAFDSCEAVSRKGAYWYATVPAGPNFIPFANDWLARGILRQCLIWEKDVLVFGRSEYHYIHEPIMFGWVPGGERLKNPDRTRVSIWKHDRPKVSTEHPTMKPVELWEHAIKDATRRGDHVFDPFCGSGTTLIACERLGRKARCIELDPAYTAVGLERWSSATGGTPALLAR